MKSCTTGGAINDAKPSFCVPLFLRNLDRFSMLSRVTRLFPLWAVLISVAAYFSPASFTSIAPHVTLLLTVIMFAMGVTLSFADFRRVFTRPAPVIAGIGLHYLVMPLAAWGIAKLLRMPPDL